MLHFIEQLRAHDLEVFYKDLQKNCGISEDLLKEYLHGILTTQGNYYRIFSGLMPEGLLKNQENEFSSMMNLFQQCHTFETIAPDRSQILKDIREHIQDASFLIPSTGEYLTEYTPLHEQRLRFVTGFTGSMGCALITPQDQFLFVDGRYTLQAQKEKTEEWIVLPLEQFKKIVSQNTKLLLDPHLHSCREINQLKDLCTIQWCEKNPVDLYRTIPAAPLSPLQIFSEKYTGSSHTERIQQITKHLRKDESFFIACPGNIMWLLGVRGEDTPCTPLSLCRAMVHASGEIDLFIDPRKISNHIEEKLSFCSIIAENSIKNYLETRTFKKILIDPKLTPCYFQNVLENTFQTYSYEEDPCTKERSIKNSIQINHIKNAHFRDGSYFSRLLYNVEKNINQWNEQDVAEHILSLKSVDISFRSLSFPSICASGANSAMCHYIPPREGSARLSVDLPLLIDCGAQYLDGTTDVTRTICLAPSEQFCKDFTLVLKGHITLARQVFPKGTTGHALDSLARQYLWNLGLDYSHGTGHGVGFYLDVHEGPQSVSKSYNLTPLEAGMIISNEPGVYREGKYGIRIESLMLVRESEWSDFLCLEPLSLIPIDTRCIDKQALTSEEKQWLNRYHTRTFNEISPLLDTPVRKWLKERCDSIL